MIEFLVALFAAWIVILVIAAKKGEQFGFDIAGPLLMWKTEKGKRTIDRIARKKGWHRYGDFAVALTAIAMVFTLGLIILNVIVAFQIPAESAPSPRLILGLPGINPVIPIGYGILALAVAIMVHEFAHGILARAGDIKVNSLGLLLLVVPIGAFVEPDEGELLGTSRKKRSRVFAVGPATNIILAIVCLLLLSFVMAPAITPTTDGVIMRTEAFDVEQWSVVTSLQNQTVADRDAFESRAETLTPGSRYTLVVSYDGTTENHTFLFGVAVLAVEKGSPADGILSEKDIVYRMRHGDTDMLLATHEDFIDFMDTASAGSVVDVFFYADGSFANATVTLADKYAYQKNDENRGKGYLGISAGGITDLVLDTDYVPTLYDPFKGNFLAYLALPFLGLSPLPDELADLYTPSTAFWVVYNVAYWLFWLNFAVGTFNALPAIPLDGGYIFKDGVSYLFSRFGKKEQQAADATSRRITLAVSLIMLACILSILLVPRLRGLISF
jgi:membrane-associated protease RseP (regulator of RpoE activity)